MQKTGILIALCFWALGLAAQSTKPLTAVSDRKSGRVVLTGGTVYQNGSYLKGASVLIEKQKIKAVGKNLDIPDGTREIDVNGAFIYPAFVELNSDYGLPEPEKVESPKKPQYDAANKGAFGWNDAVKPYQNAAVDFEPDEDEAGKLRKLGIGAVLTHHNDGIMRGTGTVTALTKSAHESIINEQASAHFSFEKGTSKQQYPRSLMGSIALLRQSVLDAFWYDQTQTLDHTDLSLQNILDAWDLPFVFHVKNYRSALRAAQLGDEWERDLIIIGNGDEYQALEQFSGVRPVVPLKLPKAPDVSDPYDALYASLEEMKHWEAAPANARMLYDAGLNPALTINGIEKWSQLQFFARQLMNNGFSESQIIDALTVVPSIMVRTENVLGRIEAGHYANLIVTSDSIFKRGSKLMESWSGGERERYEELQPDDIEGTYRINLKNEVVEVTLSKKGDAWKAKTDDDTRVTVQKEDHLITLVLDRDAGGLQKPIRLSGKINTAGKILDGRGRDASGEWFVWSAIKRGNGTDQNEEDEEYLIDYEGAVYKPAKAFGLDTLPPEEHIFIRGATIWSNDTNGVFKGDVILKNGKVKDVGKFLLYEPKMRLIEANGKHLTPGIIDEHSHIGIEGGVNEGTHASSAQVRIGDVINPDDINIYRQLAGGVTAAQQLHGSANPIGGQSALIKLRWGRNAEEMKISDADGFIKFALGENVKQSNWGEKYTERYPQTRGGVEQTYYDYFIRAREYRDQHIAYTNDRDRFIRKIPLLRRLAGAHPEQPRIDLEMEALAEILDTARFISCHSYVQSEINMLMHVADSMRFTVNTFTHILEGYKLADKMAAHGAAGSTFADWWAYKFEVKDAIPYNAAMMHKQGVLTAINSDDAEMGRRLNQEAAKAVKYGGVSEEDALKMVTLNPAKMLHLDHRMGSISKGKDADVVIWDGNPLSVYSRVLYTFVDGRELYSQKRNDRLMQRDEAERNRLIEKLLHAQSQNYPTKKPDKKQRKVWHCDDLSGGE